MAITTATQEMEHRFSWIYLFNLVFYVLPVFLVPYQLWQLGVIVLTLALFLLCYWWIHRIREQRAWLPVLCMWALASAITPLNYGSIALFAYVGFFTGMLYRLRLALALLGLQVIWLFLLSALIDVQWNEFFLYGAALNTAIFFIGVAERNRQLAIRRDAQSASEIQQLAQQLERERIARDLHDLLGHSLSSIVLKAELASKLLARDELGAAKAQLRELEDISRQSLQQVRKSVTGYRHQGLGGELQRLVDNLRSQGFAVTTGGDVPALDGIRETTLVMALTELSTNILRHSSGKAVGIYFSRHDSAFQVIVEDNGATEQIVPGNGLQGLKERLALVGGRIKLEPGSSTRVTLLIPNEAVKG
jgi:two-component system sensor histidine kinase DesK